MRNRLKSTRTTIICCIIIGILLIGLSVYAVFNNNEDWLRQVGTTPTPTEAPTPTQVMLPVKGDCDAMVLVLGVETGQNIIRVYEPETDAEYELVYNGTTDIRNRFGAVIAGSQVDSAMIAEVSFDAESKRLYSLQQTEADWRYEKQDSVTLNVEKGILAVAGNNYRFSGEVVVLENGERITLSELASVDELTVMGMGDRVFLIERSKGHGSLLLQNLDAFVGGSFYIDGKKAEKVNGDMNLTMREGEYRLTLENGELYAERSLTIQREIPAQWDLSEFLPTEPEVGRVEFLVEPEGVELYIDNCLQENTAFAELEYGEHVVGVYKNGYVGWTGKITVSSDEMLFSVSLVPEAVPSPSISLQPTEQPQLTDTPSVPDLPPADTTPVPEPDEAPTTGQKEQGTAKEDETTREVQLIWYPTSVVSVDSVYVGTTDASGLLKVKLQPGTHVIELTRIILDGSTQPKKYTVDVDAQTSVLNFFVEGLNM